MAPKPSAKALNDQKASKTLVVSKQKSRATAGKGIKKCAKTNGRLSTSQSDGTTQDRNTIRKPAKLFSKVRSCVGRKRVRKHCSMASVLTTSLDSDEAPTDYGSMFGEGSMAKLTWGKVSDQPVSAISKQRRHGGFRQLGVRRGNISTFEKLQLMPYPTDDDENSSAISLLLIIPLEVRQNIYKYLLIHKLPIVLDSNWQKVRSPASLDYTILTVNKQVLQEGTQFLYEKNVFQVLVEQPSCSLPGPVIQAKFHLHLRNVVIECLREQWAKKDHDLMVHSINLLIQANVVLDSLTTIISPQRIRNSAINAQFDDDDTITFVNFFEAPGSRLMRRITKLRCKTWNIVVRLSNTKRVLVPIDMAGTTGNKSEGGWFAGDTVTKQSGYKKTKVVRDALLGLKAKIEQIFEANEQTAIAAMEGEADALDYGQDSATGPNEEEQEAAFKNLPLQLRRKWDDEKEKPRAYELRFKPIRERLLQEISEVVHMLL